MTAKINQTRNRVISSPRDEKCITALRKEDESRKSKRRKIQANYFEISRISTVFNYFASFLSVFVVANKTQKMFERSE